MRILICILVIALTQTSFAKSKKKLRTKAKNKVSSKLGTNAMPADKATFYRSWVYTTKSEALKKQRSLRKQKIKSKITEKNVVASPTAIVTQNFTTEEKAKKFGKTYRRHKNTVVRYKGQYWTSFGLYLERTTLLEKLEDLHKENIIGLKRFIMPRQKFQAYEVVVTNEIPVDGFWDKTKKIYSNAKTVGFYQLEAAYATEDPAHWSKFKNWFFGGIESAEENFDWKLSARVFYDLAFDLESDIYSSFVKDNHQYQFIFDESYVDFEAWNLNFRLGRQNIIWGDMIDAYVSDVVSARDLRDFILPQAEVRRIPQWALLVEKHWQSTYLQLFALPIVNVDEIGVFGSDFFPLVIEDFEGFNINEEGRDAPGLGDDMGFGGKFNYRAGTWDFGLFYLNAFNRESRYERTISGNDISFKAKHFKTSKTGVTLEKDLSNYIFRMESALSLDDKVLTDDTNDEDGLVDQKILDYGFALDANWWDQGQIQFQYISRNYLDYTDDLLVDENEHFFTTKANYAFNDANWLASLTIHYGLQRKDTLVRPRFQWNLNASMDLHFGYDIFGGDENGVFGRFNNNDRLYTEYRWNF